MEHTWTILEEQVLPEHLDKTNVIKIFWFRLISREGEKTATIDGRLNLSLDDLSNFIPYQEVDFSVRISWIKNKFGDFYENINAESINQIV